MNDLLFAPEVFPASYLPKSAQGRADLWLEGFRDLCRRTDDIKTIHDEVFAALTGAVVSTRIPNAKSGKGWVYALLPDAGTRLQAARLLLAYLAGLPPSQTDMRVTVGMGSTDSQTLAEQVRDLHALGLTLADCVHELEARLPGDHGPPIDIESQ